MVDVKGSPEHASREVIVVVDRRTIWPYAALGLLWLTRGVTRNVAETADAVRRTVRPRRNGLGAMPLLAMVASGAAAMFFLDPDRGNARRVLTRDRMVGTLGQMRVRAERAGRRVAAQAYGIRQKLMHSGPRGEPAADDAELVQKVRSELGREEALASGGVGVAAKDGIVTLQGELRHPEDIRRLEMLVRRVNGVVDVENLVHLPGAPEPAPIRRPTPA